MHRKGAAADSKEFVQHRSYLDTAVNHEFYALWSLGEIKSAYIHAKEDPSFINLKKAIISLFQYQLLDGEYDESDVSGRCFVTYSSNGPKSYTKAKRLCESDDLVYHKRSDGALGVKVISDRKANFKVTKDGTLDKIDSLETHHFEIAANRKAGGTVESLISLKFDGSISNIQALDENSVEAAVSKLKNIQEQSLLPEVLMPYRSKDAISVRMINMIF